MKKIKKFQTVIISSFFSVTLFTILIINGCNKKNISEETLAEKNTSLSQKAKNHFESLAKNENATSPPPAASQQVKTIQKRITPLSKMSPHILWEKATELQTENLKYTIVPLKENIKPFKNKDYEFFRNVIFYRDESGKNNMVILEVLSSKGKSLGNNLQRVAIDAFENKYFSRSADISDLNAFVIFYNEDYTRDTSFQLVNGKWTPARISFRSDLDITQ